MLVYIMSYFLLTLTIALIIAGIDSGWHADEWFGILLAILFMPIILIVISIRGTRRKLRLKKALQEEEEKC